MTGRTSVQTQRLFLMLVLRLLPCLTLCHLHQRPVIEMAKTIDGWILGSLLTVHPSIPRDMPHSLNIIIFGLCDMPDGTVLSLVSIMPFHQRLRKEFGRELEG